MKIKYAQSENSLSGDLKRAVENYFAEKKIPQTGDWRLYVKSAILIMSAVAAYLCLFFTPMNGTIAIVTCVFLGIIFSLIGFNVMHDASHGSYSKRRWVNTTVSYSLEMMGCSSFLWHVKHVIMHHTFTNVHGQDNDIDLYPLLSTGEPGQKKLRLHRYQHLYAIVLYALQYFHWVCYTDFKKYFTRKISARPIKEIRARDHVSFWSGKFFHATFMLVIPMCYFGIHDALIGYAFFVGTCGLIISFVFQLAHIVEGREFPTPDADGTIHDSWVKKQIATTSNFATKSIVASWLLGGLNYQIVHHVFPKISHIHYRKLAPIVDEVCRKHDTPCSTMTFFGAIKSHFRMLRKLGSSK